MPSSDIVRQVRALLILGEPLLAAELLRAIPATGPDREVADLLCECGMAVLVLERDPLPLARRLCGDAARVADASQRAGLLATAALLEEAMIVRASGATSLSGEGRRRLLLRYADHLTREPDADRSASWIRLLRGWRARETEQATHRTIDELLHHLVQVGVGRVAPSPSRAAPSPPRAAPFPPPAASGTRYQTSMRVGVDSDGYVVLPGSGRTGRLGIGPVKVLVAIALPVLTTRLLSDRAVDSGLWALQWVLGVLIVLVGAGMIHVVLHPDSEAVRFMGPPPGLPSVPAAFSQLVAGVLLVAPGLLGRNVVLTPVAATGLALWTTLEAAADMSRGRTGYSWGRFLLLVAAVIIAVGRFGSYPL